MSEIQRGLVQLIQDLDRRARPGREPRNRAISKFQTISDTVQLSSDTVTTTLATPPYQYARQSYRSTVIADTPTAYWRLGENAPAVTANDEQATYPGTLGVGTLFGRAAAGGGADANTAAYFDQSSGIISVPHSTNLNTSSSAGFTVECWCLPSSSGQTEQKIVAKINAALNAYWFVSQTTAPTPGFVFTPNNATDMVFYAPASFPVNQWTHLAGVWDASTAALYYNGARVATATATSGTNSTGAVTIGGTTTIGQLFIGVIDEVAVYNSALSSDRILAHYNAMITPTATGTSLLVGAGQFK